MSVLALSTSKRIQTLLAPRVTRSRGRCKFRQSADKKHPKCQRRRQQALVARPLTKADDKALTGMVHHMSTRSYLRGHLHQQGLMSLHHTTLVCDEHSELPTGMVHHMSTRSYLRGHQHQQGLMSLHHTTLVCDELSKLPTGIVHHMSTRSYLRGHFCHTCIHTYIHTRG